jgi:murein L,D-transpeptidase YafK
MCVPAVLRMGVVLTLALAVGGGETAARRLDRVPEMAPAEEQASEVVVLKGERRLILRRGEVEIAAYDIALGFEPEGHKRREGDGRTPEGRYVIDWRNPRSAFHLSLHISYPGAADSAAAAEAGESPGGMIMIHGLPPGLRWLGAAHALRDWTAGCIAVTSEEIEEIWRLVPDGTSIEIRP